MLPRGETVESQGAAAPWSGKNRQSGPPRRQLSGGASLEDSLGVGAVLLLGGWGWQRHSSLLIFSGPLYTASHVSSRRPTGAPFSKSFVHVCV